MLIKGSGGGGGLVVDIRGIRQKRESRDFRFPEVGISANTYCMS